jgi:hypothetical protein
VEYRSGSVRSQLIPSNAKTAGSVSDCRVGVARRPKTHKTSRLLAVQFTKMLYAASSIAAASSAHGATPSHCLYTQNNQGNLLSVTNSVRGLEILLRKVTCGQESSCKNPMAWCYTHYVAATKATLGAGPKHALAGASEPCEVRLCVCLVAHMSQLQQSTLPNILMAILAVAQHCSGHAVVPVVV